MKRSFSHQVSLKFAPEFQEHRQDASAILLTPDKHLWLASDETTTIECFSWNGNQSFDNQRSFKVSNFIDLPEPDDQEIDIEGFDYDNSYLWLVGSHSWKRKKPKPDKSDLKNIQRLATIATEKNRYILARIPLVKGELYKSCQHPDNPNQQLNAGRLQLTKTGNLLTKVLKTDAHLGMFVSSTVPSKDNGFDIEGIAVSKNKVLLGLRGPVLRGWAMILELEVAESSPGILTLNSIGENRQQYRKHFVDLKGLGVRDLCFDGEDLLILAGPTMDLDGPVKVFRLTNARNLPNNTLFKPDLVMNLPYGDGEDHAEGMTLFDAIAKQHSLLVVYDSPAQTRLKGESEVLADVFKLQC
ncbi:hypothetical protein Cri9333_2123 [Crinalium epipsammum PCC 9333]|uniref:DUF3616 domain-containing protein n=1 Tax=Crinalium epipsammum PCC 9333 TaxID=1173022 RepID=K9W0R1_9CYAN|nr:DUF3616 domain-containing protein [Crinalium epipsammum]AFZ13000.1 hypothetical protein Cri9333_2123 [Crinalium epipsammum PCC 9333]